jgi:hypothetical protein
MENAYKAEEPVVVASMDEEGAFVIVLHLPVDRLHAEVTFKFLPVIKESAETDISENQLRLAEEEAEKIKKEGVNLQEDNKDVIVLVPTGCSPDNAITWSTAHSSPSNVYELSADNQGIRILQGGMYQIACRFNHGPLTLQFNGVPVTAPTTSSFSDIFQLQVNDIITITTGCQTDFQRDVQNQKESFDGTNFRLSILKLLA